MIVKNEYSSGLEWIKVFKLPHLPPAYSTPLGCVFHTDALVLLKALPSDCIDLVMTSPPFALTRKKEYGNEPIDRYIEWFWPFCLEIRRVLKPTGSFVLDIGGSWVPGAPVRSVYHFDLAVRLAKLFFLAQEFYWYNPARLPTPAEWVTVRRLRVKDAVNMVWWFSKTEWPKADNRKVLQPYSESQKTLMKRGYTAKRRPSGHDISQKAFGKDNGGAIPPNLLEIEWEEPSNLLKIANTVSYSPYLRACRERGIKPHPARYPEPLVRFFLNFLTDEYDLVLDPFAGSNVTGAECEVAGRRWLATEMEASYIEGSLARFQVGPLFDAPEPERGATRRS